MSVARAEHSGPWTVADVLALPEDPGTRTELVGGFASPSMRITDKTVKPALYAAGGIQHYWRLELDPPRLYVGELERGAYIDRLITPAGAAVSLRSLSRSRSTRQL